jgi:exosortase O
LFLIAATWIDRRRLNLRWLLVALIFACLLLIANLARVALLVAVGQVAGWRLLAEMLHVPLGVLGFAGACSGGVMLLQRLVPVFEMEPPRTSEPRRPAWLLPLVAGTVLVMAFLYTPKPLAATAYSTSDWQFPAELSAEPWPFTAQEQEWFARDSAGTAERWRFRWGNLSGSMLVVTSTDWRAQHRPERCFEVYGLTIDNSSPYLVAPDFPMRLVSLGEGKKRDLHSAAYWFQSTTGTTEDYAARIWSDLALHPDPWVLVTLLFDRATDPRSTQADNLYLALHQTIYFRLAGGVTP